MSKGTLYIFCGKMPSGKSTLANIISQQKSSVLIGEDEMLGKLYSREITDVLSYVQCSEKLKSAMRPIIVSLLKNGTSVMLDFPANTLDQLKWMKEIVYDASALYEFHYIDCANKVSKAQLSKEPPKILEDAVQTHRKCSMRYPNILNYP